MKPTHYFIHCIDCGTFINKYPRDTRVAITKTCKNCKKSLRIYLKHTFNFKTNEEITSKIFCKNQQIIMCDCCFNDIS